MPDCSELTAADGKYRLGLATPMNNPALEVRLYELGMFYQDLAVCRTGWSEVLPSATPWGPNPAMEKYTGYAAFGVALLITLLLYTQLPREWRRNVTALGILGVVTSTWLLGSAGLVLAKSMGLSQQLYDEVVVLQESRGEEQWFEVRGVWDLDRRLMAQGLTPDLSLTHLKAKPVADAVELRETPEGEVVDGASAEGATMQPTGNHQVVNNVLLVEVLMIEAVAEEEESTVNKDADNQPPIVEELPVTTETEVKRQVEETVEVSAVTEAEVDAPIDEQASVDTAPVQQPEPTRPTYWVDRNEVEFGPAILDPNGKRFRVHRALNIRQSPGVQHPQVAGSPLHRGTEVEVVSRPRGDWWKVKVGDTDQVGWVSSLWLRRIEP